MSDVSARAAKSQLPTITLTTDFGVSSPYVAQMKGVLIGACPDVRLVDVTHAVPPQDVAAGALVLADCCRWFPPASVHLAVVDPGVGTSRRILAAHIGEHRFVFPDNGLITLLVSALSHSSAPRPRVVAVDSTAVPTANRSHTFHGRDIMAPVAACLAQGAAVEELGPPIGDWIVLDLLPTVAEKSIEGRVLWVDDFGNLVTNIRQDVLPPRFRVEVGGHRVDDHVQTYGQRDSGCVVSLVGSSGWLEVAVVNGSAAAQLSLARGAEVRVYVE